MSELCAYLQDPDFGVEGEQCWRFCKDKAKILDAPAEAILFIEHEPDDVPDLSWRAVERKFHAQFPSSDDTLFTRVTPRVTTQVHRYNYADPLSVQVDAVTVFGEERARQMPFPELADRLKHVPGGARLMLEEGGRLARRNMGGESDENGNWITAARMLAKRGLRLTIEQTDPDLSPVYRIVHDAKYANRLLGRKTAERATRPSFTVASVYSEPISRVIWQLTKELGYFGGQELEIKCRRSAYGLLYQLAHTIAAHRALYGPNAIRLSCFYRYFLLDYWMSRGVNITGLIERRRAELAKTREKRFAAQKKRGHTHPELLPPHPFLENPTVDLLAFCRWLTRESRRKGLDRSHISARWPWPQLDKKVAKQMGFHFHRRQLSQRSKVAAAGMALPNDVKQDEDWDGGDEA